jgi:hypothetical protein
MKLRHFVRWLTGGPDHLDPYSVAENHWIKHFNRAMVLVILLAIAYKLPIWLGR